MKKLEDYVRENYLRELNEVKNSDIAKVKSLLSIEERTLIYKYTEDGYASLNEKLRISKGEDITEFGKFLDKVLSKLPNYQDITYRASDLTAFEFKKYVEAKNNSGILVEHSFISASKSKEIAYGFGRKYRFRIFSRTGKDIEAFAKYGIHHPQNEREILFRPNIDFKVLDITIDKAYTFITLEECK